jgi:hypothetical protein
MFYISYLFVLENIIYIIYTGEDLKLSIVAVANSVYFGAIWHIWFISSFACSNYIGFW